MMQTFRLKSVLLSCLMLFSTAPVWADMVAGWVEPVMLQTNKINLMAKLDTGAQNSSLNSQNIETFSVNGKQHVRFEVRSREGQVHKLERPLLRFATIKRHFGNSQQRPVVQLTICLGKIVKKVEVNLVDRSGFSYQFLLGRSFLAADVLVDSARERITRPDC